MNFYAPLAPLLLLFTAPSASGDALVPAKVRIVEPAEGTTTQLSFNVVLTVDTDDAEGFQRQYKESYACLQVSSLPRTPTDPII